MLRTYRGRRGGYAIEFAMVLPIFVAALLSLFEFSYAFYTRANMIAGIAQGCRMGATIDPLVGGPTGLTPEETAENEIERIMTGFGYDCGSGPTNCDMQVIATGATPRSLLECRVEVNYDSIANFGPVDAILPATITAQTASLLELQR